MYTRCVYTGPEVEFEVFWCHQTNAFQLPAYYNVSTEKNTLQIEDCDMG